MNIHIIQFQKPAHETDGKFWINLRVDKVEAIKKAKKMIVIKLPQGYCQPVNPQVLLKHGTRTEAIFLYPNNPLKLVGQYFELLSENLQESAKYNSYFWENYG